MPFFLIVCSRKNIQISSVVFTGSVMQQQTDALTAAATRRIEAFLGSSDSGGLHTWKISATQPADSQDGRVAFFLVSPVTQCAVSARDFVAVSKHLGPAYCLTVGHPSWWLVLLDSAQPASKWSQSAPRQQPYASGTGNREHKYHIWIEYSPANEPSTRKHGILRRAAQHIRTCKPTMREQLLFLLAFLVFCWTAYQLWQHWRGLSEPWLDMLEDLMMCFLRLLGKKRLERLVPTAAK